MTPSLKNVLWATIVAIWISTATYAEDTIKVQTST
jgi:hypothetical protein